MKNLLIVESPAKAKTIEKYLGPDFTVLSSVGHIRKDTKVDKTTFDVTYEITDDHADIVKKLTAAAKKADTIWLATDEDREGEAISWHLIEVLNLPKDTNRITFHEITKPALEQAIQHPRTLDTKMVDSQKARQTLDMLVGFDLSGVVRKKVAGAISAGRVQSPALKLVVEREREIEAFKTKSEYKVTADFGFKAELNKKFPDESSTTAFLESLKSATFTVSDILTTKGTKSAPTPFTTASLQIEASSKLGFSPRTTMSAAQGLYQAGHISYHRTDSLNLSASAISELGTFIAQKYGEKYHHSRNFKTKSASAQEAHEAIRPTHVTTEKAGKNSYEQRLYDLIRARTLASQMSNAILEKTTIKITIANQTPIFEAKGEVITFDGFLKVYGRAKDTELPQLQTGDILTAYQIAGLETFKKPPARYTEGSLVKKLEELGIGRPSTYAGILTALQARDYITKGINEGQDREVIELTLKNNTIKRNILTEKTGSEKGKLIPTPMGELVSDFLAQNFDQIVDYGFTANVEKDLDKIAEGSLGRVEMLRDFYTPFSKLVGNSAEAERVSAARELGLDPASNKPIFAKHGKNGDFLQLGDNEKTTGEKPKFFPMPKNTTLKTIQLEQALEQLKLPTLPRSLGNAKDGTEIIASSGPFGPYLKAGTLNVQLKDHDPYTIALVDAEELYEAKKASIIHDWGDIKVIIGAYGPYVKGPGRFNNAKIPKDTDPKSLTLESAKELLDQKPKKSTRRAPRKTTRQAAKKTTRKTTKKSPAKTAKKSTK